MKRLSVILISATMLLLVALSAGIRLLYNHSQKDINMQDEPIKNWSKIIKEPTKKSGEKSLINEPKLTQWEHFLAIVGLHTTRNFVLVTLMSLAVVTLAITLTSTVLRSRECVPVAVEEEQVQTEVQLEEDDDERESLFNWKTVTMAAIAIIGLAGIIYTFGSAKSKKAVGLESRFANAKRRLQTLIKYPGLSKQELKTIDFEGLASEAPSGQVSFAGKEIDRLQDPVRTLMRYWWLEDGKETLIPDSDRFINLDSAENIPTGDEGKMEALIKAINTLIRQVEDYKTCAQLISSIENAKGRLICRAGDITAQMRTDIGEEIMKFFAGGDKLTELRVFPGDDTIEWSVSERSLQYLLKVWAEDIKNGCFLQDHFYLPVDGEFNMYSRAEQSAAKFVVDLFVVRDNPRVIENVDHRRNLIRSLRNFKITVQPVLPDYNDYCM